MAENPFDLSGKVALITGGNGGIGLGMAKSLARAGADVCIWGTNPKKTEAAEAELQAIGGKARGLLCDVSDETAVDKMFAETLESFGRVDACFANAGVGSGRGSAFSEMTTEEWRRVLDVNLDGAFFTLRAATRHMQERGGGGSLVTTASLAALMGVPKGEHYSASKGALISMTKGLAVELAREGIRANVIIPGWIESAMTEKFFAMPVVQERVLTRVPMRRWGVAGDFGGIAVYLASDASAYHTGDTFLIDGGYALF